MKNHLRSMWKNLQRFSQRRVGGKCDHLGRGRRRMGGGLAPEANDIKSGIVQGGAEDGSDFAGGVVGDPAHGIDRLVGGTTGDEGKRHVRSLRRCFVRLNSQVTGVRGPVRKITMNVLLAAAEMTPFVQSGTLADALAELAGGLQKSGHAVSVVLPFYRHIRKDTSVKMKRARMRFSVEVGEDLLPCEIREAETASGIRVFFVVRDEFFDRSGIYGVEDRDYQDNAARFIFFSKCVVELATRMDKPPEILHLNSWETAMVPALVRHRQLQVRTVLTPHSLEFQGNFWSYDFALMNLPNDWFSARGVEYYGSMNCLKAGLIFADAVVFPSECMVGAVQTAEYGCGLDTVLREQQNKLMGFPTDTDLAGWEPSDDRGGDRLALQKALSLKGDGPILACVAEATAGRGVDVLLAALDRMIAAGNRVVLLGASGTSAHRTGLETAIRKHRGRFVWREKFAHKLAKAVLAGSDLFLLPGVVEPQTTWLRRALRYGCVPMARQCEGLFQLVRDWDPAGGFGNGFVFYAGTADALVDACRRTTGIWAGPALRAVLQSRCLEKSFSPASLAADHVRLYERLLGRSAAVAA